MTTQLPATSSRRGAMLVLVAIVLPVLLMMAAFAVNVAYMELTRTELRVAADFAARAGSRTYSLHGSPSQAIAACQESATRNKVCNQPLALESAQVELGSASRDGLGRYAFQAGGEHPNAVRVHADRLRAGGAVNLFFGQVVGTETFAPVQTAIAAQVDRDIAIVLDRSGSMVYVDDHGNRTSWTDGDPAPADCRWTSAVAAVNAFLATLEATPMEERVALVSYNQTATLDCDLGLDCEPIRAALDSYTQAYYDGSTNISDGIDLGRHALLERGFGRDWAAKTIVVLTDGIHNTGAMTPVDATSLAVSQGAFVHAISFGLDADTAQMEDVAYVGYGQHWHAPGQAELQRAFEEIAQNCPTLLVD